ncbi:MAG: transporter (formate/nitrite transporter family protein) [Azospirillum brasilense]|nr:MAG: transporter (formate/nitrite transporter family protein) [Azospirillum brasilense]
MADEQPGGMTESEKESAEELAAPRSRVIHEVIRRQGEEELARPVGSLFWSGIAGGLAITTSVFAEGALRHKLPAGMPGREAISDLGYSLGFLMVILGRMQLFTEQTIVTVLPVMAAPGWRRLGLAARLWAVVFAANMVGTCVAAAVSLWLPLAEPPVLASMVEISSELLRKTPLDILRQGIPAGFLIASVAWIRGGISSGDFWVVFVLTYAIALGGFTHVVAGSAEAFLLLFAGQAGLGQVLGGIILPALLGNIIGGTGLFALLAHAQVRQEI